MQRRDQRLHTKAQRSSCCCISPGQDCTLAPQSALPSHCDSIMVHTLKKRDHKLACTVGSTRANTACATQAPACIHSLTGNGSRRVTITMYALSHMLQGNAPLMIATCLAAIHTAQHVRTALPQSQPAMQRSGAAASAHQHALSLCKEGGAGLRALRYPAGWASLRGQAAVSRMDIHARLPWLDPNR